MWSRCLNGLANPRWKAGLTVSERGIKECYETGGHPHLPHIFTQNLGEMS